MKNIPPAQIGMKDIYASNFLHTTLWAFISGQRMCGKDVSEAIRSFINYFGMEETDEGTLRGIFYRKDKEFKKCATGICSDAKSVFKPDEIDKTLGLVKKILTHGEG